MITAEERAWCAISDARGIGPKTLWSIAEYLIHEHKTATWLLEHPAAMKTALNGRSDKVDTSEITISEPEEIDDSRVAILHPLHPDFPQRLKTLKDRLSLPALLYTRGNTAIFSKPGVAIVGARHAGDHALEAADRLAAELARKGINVTSGYAKGIDTAAHVAALRNGGTTIIVLSEGINQFRPKRELRNFFTNDNTLVVSQFEPDARWAAHFAMTRNKLVCALSQALVVIVSGLEKDADGKMSGTFNAGATAIEVGIPVFTVTPSFFDDEPEGNKQLISRGCQAWNPSDGADPIVSAIQEATPFDSEMPVAKSNKTKLKQLDLFETKK